MLRRVPLTRDFRTAVAALPDDWADARFVLRLRDEAEAARASAFLGGLNAARHRDTVRFTTAPRGGHTPDAVARALTRLEREGIDGQLELAGADSHETRAATARRSLAVDWDAELAALPPDWSDIYAELAVDSTDYLERGALLLSPVNPARHRDRAALRFRCARSFGYGAAAGMVRRCLERLDEEGITGTVSVLRALSDTKPWATQGPVWYVGGKAV
jgi:hypothetical protein